MPERVYLVHEKSKAAAGWYPKRVADVLLRRGRGWHEADPTTGAEVEEGNRDFADLTLAQLHAYAEANDVDLGGARKKADVLAVLRARDVTP